MGSRSVSSHVRNTQSPASLTGGSTQCIHDHGAEAWSLYWLPGGCFCFTEELQYLRLYHADRSRSPRYEMQEFVYWGA
jgi:hypothetical protein